MQTIVRGFPNTGFEQRVLKTKKAKTSRFGTSVYRITKITPKRPAALEVQRAQAWEILSSEAQRQAVEALETQLAGQVAAAHDLHAADDPRGLHKPPIRRVTRTAPQPEEQGRNLVHPPMFG